MFATKVSLGLEHPPLEWWLKAGIWIQGSVLGSTPAACAKEQSSWGLGATNRYSGAEDQRQTQLVCISGEQSSGEAGLVLSRCFSLARALSAL